MSGSQESIESISKDRKNCMVSDNSLPSWSPHAFVSSDTEEDPFEMEPLVLDSLDPEYTENYDFATTPDETIPGVSESKENNDAVTEVEIFVEISGTNNLGKGNITGDILKNHVPVRLREEAVGSDNKNKLTCESNAKILGEEQNHLRLKIVSSQNKGSCSYLSSTMVPLELEPKSGRSFLEENSKDVFDIFAGWHVATGGEYNGDSNEKTDIPKLHVLRQEADAQCSASSHRSKNHDPELQPHRMESSRTSGLFVPEIEVLESKLTNKVNSGVGDGTTQNFNGIQTGFIKLEHFDPQDTETQIPEKKVKRTHKIKVVRSRKDEKKKELKLKHCRPCSILMERLPDYILHTVFSRNQSQTKNLKRLVEHRQRAKKHKHKHKKHRRKESWNRNEIQRELLAEVFKLKKDDSKFISTGNKNMKNDKKIQLKKADSALGEEDAKSKIKKKILNDSIIKKKSTVMEHEVIRTSGEQSSAKTNDANKENNSKRLRVLSDTKSNQQIKETGDANEKKDAPYTSGSKSMQIEMLEYTECVKNILTEYCTSVDISLPQNGNSQEPHGAENNNMEHPKIISNQEDDNSESKNSYVWKLKRKRVLRTDAESSEDESFFRKHRANVRRMHKRKEVRNTGLTELKIKSNTTKSELRAENNNMEHPKIISDQEDDNSESKNSYVRKLKKRRVTRTDAESSEDESFVRKHRANVRRMHKRKVVKNTGLTELKIKSNTTKSELRPLADENSLSTARDDLVGGKTRVFKELSVSLCRLEDMIKEQIRTERPKSTGTLDSFVKKTKRIVKNHVKLPEKKVEHTRKTANAISSQSILKYFTKCVKDPSLNTIGVCDQTEQTVPVSREDEEFPVESEEKRDAILKEKYAITKEVVVILIRLETYGISSPKKYLASEIENLTEKYLDCFEKPNFACTTESLQLHRSLFTSPNNNIPFSRITSFSNNVDGWSANNTECTDTQNPTSSIQPYITDSSEKDKFANANNEDSFVDSHYRLHSPAMSENSRQNSPIKLRLSLKRNHSATWMAENSSVQETVKEVEKLSCLTNLEDDFSCVDKDLMDIIDTQSTSSNSQSSAENSSDEQDNPPANGEISPGNKWMPTSLLKAKSAGDYSNHTGIRIVSENKQYSTVISSIEREEHPAKKENSVPGKERKPTLHFVNGKSTKDSPKPIVTQNVSSKNQSFIAKSLDVSTPRFLTTKTAVIPPKESVMKCHSSLQNTVVSGNSAISEDKRNEKLVTELLRFKLAPQKSEDLPSRCLSSLVSSEGSNRTAETVCDHPIPETVDYSEPCMLDISDYGKVKNSSPETGFSSEEFSSHGVLPIQTIRNDVHEEPAKSILQKTQIEACATCNTGFQNDQLRLEHNEATHSYKCSICTKIFMYPKKLRQHMLTHTNGKPTQCIKLQKPLPEEKFNKHCLKNSRVQDDCDKSDYYVCLICGRSYRLNCNLRKHCYRVHKSLQKKDIIQMSTSQMTSGRKKNNTLLSCDICNLSFKSKKGLKKHKCSYILTTRDYHCSVCSLLFNSKESLFIHLIKHTEREYQDAERALKAKLEKSRLEKDTCQIEKPETNVQNDDQILLLCEKDDTRMWKLRNLTVDEKVHETEKLKQMLQKDEDKRGKQNLQSDEGSRRIERNEHKLQKTEEDSGAEMRKQMDGNRDKVERGSGELQMMIIDELRLEAEKTKQKLLEKGAEQHMQNLQSNDRNKITEKEEHKLRKVGVEGDADRRKQKLIKVGGGHLAEGRKQEFGRKEEVETTSIEKQIMQSDENDYETEMRKSKQQKSEKSHRTGRDKYKSRKYKNDDNAEGRKEKFPIMEQDEKAERHKPKVQRSEVHSISEGEKHKLYGNKNSNGAEEASDKQRTSEDRKAERENRECNRKTGQKTQKIQRGEDGNKKDTDWGSKVLQRSDGGHEAEDKERHDLRTDGGYHKTQEGKERLESDETHESVREGQQLLESEIPYNAQRDKRELKIGIMENCCDSGKVRIAETVIVMNEKNETVEKQSYPTATLSKDVTLKLRPKIQTKKTGRIVARQTEEKEKDGEKVGAELVEASELPSLICNCHKNYNSKDDNNIKFELTLFCVPCRTLFRTSDCFYNHVNGTMCLDTKHGDRIPRILCSSCHTILDSLQAMYRHIEEHWLHNIRDTVAFVCKICKIVFLRIGPMFYKHWFSHQVDQLYVESHNTFSRTSVVDASHLKSFSYELTKKYLFISESSSIRKVPFEIESELAAQMTESIHASPEFATVDERLHQILSFECSICNKVFSNKVAFDLHLRDHREILTLLNQSTDQSTTTGKTKSACNICKTVYTSALYSEVHWHDLVAQNFMCNYCMLVVDNLNDFQLHWQKHKNEKHKIMCCKVLFIQSKFQCKCCSVRFGSQSALDKHFMPHVKVAIPLQSLPSKSTLDSGREKSAKATVTEIAVSNQDSLENITNVAILNQEVLKDCTSQATVLIQEASKDSNPEIQLLNGKIPENRRMEEKIPGKIEVIDGKDPRKSLLELVDLAEPKEDVQILKNILSTAPSKYSYGVKLEALNKNCCTDDQKFSNKVEIVETEKENQLTREESVIAQEKDKTIDRQKESNRGFLRVRSLTELQEKQWYKCSTCGLTFDDQRKLNDHAHMQNKSSVISQAKSKEVSYACKVCKNFQGQSDSALKHHLSFRCPGPDKQDVNDLGKCVQTLLLQSSRQIYNCNQCPNFTCDTEEALRQHMSLHLFRRMYSCRICSNYVCETEQQIQQHEATHLQRPVCLPLVSTQLQNVLQQTNTVNVCFPMQQEQRVNTVMTTLQPMETVLQTSLSYSTVPIYTCQFCKNFQCYTEQQLKIHELGHMQSGIREKSISYIKCKYCPNDVFFENNERLNEHETISHKFTCKQCAKVFVLENQLQQHELTHRSSEMTCQQSVNCYLSFFCKLCLVGFTHESELHLHEQLKHSSTTLMPVGYQGPNSWSFTFQCDICGMILCSQNELNFHKRTHGLY